MSCHVRSRKILATKVKIHAGSSGSGRKVCVTIAWWQAWHNLCSNQPQPIVKPSSDIHSKLDLPLTHRCHLLSPLKPSYPIPWTNPRFGQLILDSTSGAKSTLTYPLQQCTIYPNTSGCFWDGSRVAGIYNGLSRSQIICSLLVRISSIYLEPDVGIAGDLGCQNEGN